MIPDNDREDFLKPIEILNANNELIVIHSEESKESKQSLNKYLKNQNVNELMNYTAKRRDSPNNSFYGAKKEEIEQIIEIADEESIKDSTPKTKIEESKSELKNQKNKDHQFEDCKEKNDESEIYKEEIHNNSEFKKKLESKTGKDFISDFTHVGDIELVKKYTEVEKNRLKIKI